MKHLIFLLLALSHQLWAANNNDIDIKKLENQSLRSSLNITLHALLRALIN